jgi:hypothetical protein
LDRTCNVTAGEAEGRGNSSPAQCSAQKRRVLMLDSRQKGEKKKMLNTDVSSKISEQSKIRMTARR